MEIPIEILSRAFNGTVVDEFTGNSGKVFLVKNNSAVPRFIAYKRCKELNIQSQKLFDEEVLKWNSISSRHIVPIYYVHVVAGEYYACMRACEGNLEDFLKEPISPVAAFNYSLQIIKGLIDINNSSIEHHQDFNPQNILFEDLTRLFNGFPPLNYDPSHRYRMMISDFAMSNYYVKDSIEGKSGGKFPFKAPEQYEGSYIQSFEPDRFALGVLLCLLFSGKHPCGYDAGQVLRKNAKKLKPSWKSWAHSEMREVAVDNIAIKELILKLLSKEPEARPNFTKCFEIIHSQYSKLNSEQLEVAMFYINHFEQQNIDWPRGKIKYKFN